MGGGALKRAFGLKGVAAAPHSEVGVLGAGLDALRYGVLGQLLGEQQAHGLQHLRDVMGQRL